MFVQLALAADGEETKSDDYSKPIFVSMLPHFLVNLADNLGQRFMQLKAKTQVADKATERALMLHMPAVRHYILMKLCHLRPQDVRSSEQKEELRQELTEIIRATLLSLSDSQDVKGFYITSLVIQ
jgi:flagellar FliL protein